MKYTFNNGGLITLKCASCKIEIQTKSRTRKYCDECSIKVKKEKDKEEIEKIRRCDIKFIKRDNDTGWIIDRLNFIVKSLNDQFYNLNLNGYDAFQYTSYDSAESGTYDWHIDTHLGHENLPSNMHEPRKLSLS